MKYLLVLTYFLSFSASALVEDLRPLIFPGTRVFAVGEHKLLVSANEGAINQTLLQTAPDRVKLLPVLDRAIVGVLYVRGVPFVVTHDRKQTRLEWAVVTTYQEGLSPRQRGGLVLSTLAVEASVLAFSPDWKTAGILGAATLVGSAIARPVLARWRGLQDLELALRPAQLDGRPVTEVEVETDAQGQLTNVYLGRGEKRVSLRDLDFRKDQADRLVRRPGTLDEEVVGRRVSLSGGRLIAKSRLWESGGAAELAEGDDAFQDLFRFRNATFVVRADQTFEQVRVMRRAKERTLYLTLEPVTLNAIPVRVKDLVRAGDGRVIDVMFTAELPVEGLVDLVSRPGDFVLSGFPVEAGCSSHLKTAAYQP